MKRLQVVAGILTDAAQRILIAERLGDGPFHGLWEFPGGKIAAGETARSALLRELREELGIAMRSCEPFMRLEHNYADRRVDLQFFRVADWAGEPRGAEGQLLKWLAAEQIAEEQMLPADLPVIQALRKCLPEGH